jgi:hypothetical protein
MQLDATLSWLLPETRDRIAYLYAKQLYSQI